MPAVLISHQRSVSQQMPSTRGSVLLKLLEPAKRELDELMEQDGEKHSRKAVFNQRFEQAMEVLRTLREPPLASNAISEVSRVRARVGDRLSALFAGAG